MVVCFTATKDRKLWSRRNGWSLPLHPLQVLAWLFLVMFATLYFGVLVPSLPPGAWQITTYVINCVVFLIHVVIHLISVSLNPADNNVRAKASKGPLPSFDRNKHNHVIENQYCHICEVKVGSKSKHCSACNKCVSEFDHHCKWLNNCVGGRNYRLFLFCVSTALLGCLLIFFTSVALIIAYLDSKSWLYSSPSFDNGQMSLGTSNSLNVGTNSSVDLSISHSTHVPMSTTLSINTTSTGYFVVFVPVSSITWLITIICTAALSFLAIALLGHLLGFHIYLMCQNFTTYDYIVQRRDVGPPPLNNNSGKSGSKFLDFPLNFLQRMKTKKANQITPEGKESGSKGDQIEEWELQNNIHHRSPEGTNPTLPIVTDQRSVAKTEEEENQLEHYVGNVYIGSPHRRRHYLEPIQTRSKYSSPELPPIGKSGSAKSNEITTVQVIENDKEDNTSSDSDVQDSSKDISQSHAYAHGLARRHLRSPSPAPLLSPILESEVSTGSAIVSWKHRSVSEQSLHLLTEDEEEALDTSTCSVEVERPDNGSLGSREDSGSLSNLFMSSKDQDEDMTENNNNCQKNLSHEDDRVHEVHIIPQGSINGYKFRDNCNSNDSIKNLECNDPFINGELWAYAPRNGCHLPDGIVSFRRSSSMQDSECVNHVLHSRLTRCRSEDEIKSGQRVVRLQRRLSEDQNLWMLQEADNTQSKPSKELASKSGVSATAVFSVEESEDSFQIPNVLFSGKRKYNHFTVPSHVVLPCNNAIHPESRKRTRAVGSKPPKAFHA